MVCQVSVIRQVCCTVNVVTISCTDIALFMSLDLISLDKVIQLVTTLNKRAALM